MRAGEEGCGSQDFSQRGEGAPNMFPRAAFHGIRWWEIDLSAYVIRTLGGLDLAWNI
jgi:stearoyl-CoA desaturase (delta-9 desaturase)